ncbi:MAG: transcription termination factor Rho [Clostridia bacterium]|nr:transcription termination factor Rho [Clostridia bacterium]
MSEDFEKMSVVELRKAAKDMGVKLGAGINKQGIIEKLNEAREKAAPPAPPASRLIRSAAIITDDESEDEDVPVLTPNPRLARPAAPRPTVQNAPGSASSLSTISSKAPAFTMEGSRAWHNPRPYQNAAPGYQRNQNWANPRPAPNAAASQRTYTAANQPQTRPSPNYTSRFGPDQTAQEPTPTAHDYRPNHYAASGVDYQPAEGAAAPAQQSTYARPGVPYQQQQPQQGYAPGPSLPELLAAGDVGDGEGVLEMHPDGYGILRTMHPHQKDIYISNAQIRRFSLRTGDYIAGKTRPQRESDRYIAMLYITDINGHAAEEVKSRPNFDTFTAIYPRKRINLSGRSQDSALRLIDLLSPIGFGQRALITCASKADKTGMLKKLSAAVSRNYPKTQVKVLLIDEKPEEVTDVRETLKADVIATTFDQAPEAQVKVFDLFLERAQRLVEDGRDVVVLLDSLTRMARICNQVMPATVRTLNSGLAAGAMLRPKKYFGAARNTREGGTLTMIAFASCENALDNAILEEIKGAANMELALNGAGALGFDPLEAATRKAELLLTEQENQVEKKIREMLKDAPSEEAAAQLLSMLEKTESNDELVQKFDGWMSL